METKVLFVLMLAYCANTGKKYGKDKPSYKYYGNRKYFIVGTSLLKLHFISYFS